MREPALLGQVPTISRSRIERCGGIMKTLIGMLAIAAPCGGAAVMLTASTATADGNKNCEMVSGALEEDPGGAANCPTGHPNCFMGAVDGPRLHATTLFFAESAVTG